MIAMAEPRTSISLSEVFHALVHWLRDPAVHVYGKRILKFLDITEATGDSQSESRVVDQLKFDSLFFFWAGSRSLTYIPHWIPYFDSFAAPELAEKVFPRVPAIKVRRTLHGCRVSVEDMSEPSEGG